MHERAADDLTTIGGQFRKLAPQGLFELDENGVVFSRSDGGGGLGDPLDRPTDAVLRDVRGGAVSVEQARDLYGVVLDGAAESVDEIATSAVRSRVRRERAGKADDVNGTAFSAPNAHSSDGQRHIAQPVVLDPAGRAYRCRSCGYDLGPISENWKAHAAEHSASLASLGDLWNSERFVLRSYACPGCGTLLDAEMTLPEDPPIWNYMPLR
jgi:N-methylhydantoinase B